MKMLFADTLKKLRKEKGLSQQALAEKLYVTNAAVSRWESGHRLPDDVMMCKGTLTITRREGGGTAVTVFVPQDRR
jgi:transcriptional regulator with XRE-family HTH domain